MQFLATSRKKYFRIGQKFMFLVTKKESENRKLPSGTVRVTDVFTIAFHLYFQTTFFKYCLSSSAFIFLTLIVF